MCFPCSTLSFLSFLSVLLLPGCTCLLYQRLSKIYLSLCVLRIVWSSLHGIFLLLLKCMNIAFLLLIQFFELTFHFLFLPFWHCPCMVMFFSHTCIPGFVLFLSWRSLKSLWFNLFWHWLSLPLCLKCYSFMELPALLNSFFPSSYLSENLGNQFIYPSPLL